ncbi:MAG: choice-of-anchor J domain-containing protein [Marinicellaceae bacterium]
MKKHLLLLPFINLFIVFIATAQTTSTEQGFENIVNLPGWTTSNQSNPVGETNWFQGNSGIFTAQQGLIDSYIAANFNNAAGEEGSSGTICNYLIMPDLGNIASLSFFTRSTRSSNNFNVYPDRLYLVYSPTGEINTGNCTDGFGDFTETLLVINEELTTMDYDSNDENPVGYPLSNWQLFVNEIMGDGRIAFVYYVEDAGFYGPNSNHIGIDTVRWIPNFPEVIFKGGFE